MQTSTIENRVDLFIETCRLHGLKVTPQRIAIFRALIRSDHHPTADTMFRTVRREYPHISFDTVNRTLLTFAHIGLAEVVETFGGPKRFDSDVGVHHHLHCVSCGRIIDFTHEGYSRLEVPATLTEKFQVISKRVVLKGYCDQCTPSS